MPVLTLENYTKHTEKQPTKNKQTKKAENVGLRPHSLFISQLIFQAWYSVSCWNRVNFLHCSPDAAGLDFWLKQC